MPSRSKPPIDIDELTLNNLPVAVILHDSSKIYFANPKAVKLLGLNIKTGNNLISNSLPDLISVTDKKKIKKYCNTCLKQKEKNTIVLQFVNSKNITTDIELNSGTTNFKNKLLIQSVLTVKEPIKSHFSSSNKLTPVVNEINTNQSPVEFHYLFVPKRGLKYIGKSVSLILGYTAEALIKNVNLLANGVVNEDQHNNIFLEPVFLEKTKRNKKIKVEIAFKHKKGHIKQLQINATGLYNSKNKICGFIGVITDLTEKKETEKLLIETKDKFDLITNYSNEVISFYSFTPEQRYLYVSPNIEKVLGYKPSDLLNDKYFFRNRIIGSREDFDRADKFLIKIQKSNSLKHHSSFFKTTKKNGEEVWLENNLVPIADKKGKVRFFIYIIRDITIQKEKEIELELQYTNYRNLLDNSPVAYVIHDHGVCLYVNNVLTSLLKVKSKNQILGKFVLDFFLQEDRKKLTNQIGQLYKNKKAGKQLHNLKIKDLQNNIIDVEIESVLIKFNNKQCILSLVKNLSEQRQREREKQKVITIEAANALLQKEIKERLDAEKNLMETTAHLSSIFESSSHMLWTIGRNYNITSFNKNYASVIKNELGLEIEPGMRIDKHLEKNKQNYVDFWHSRYAIAFKGQKLEFEKEDENNTGKVYRKVFINPIYNDRNEITELSCIANDITDSKIYEQKLLNQTGKLTAIFDSSHHYIWTINRLEKLTSFNKNYYDLVTALYNTKPYVGLVLDRGVLANDKEYNMLLKYHYERAFNGTATSFEIETRNQEFKNVYLEIFLNPIYENDKVVEVSGIAHNITEKKHVQQRMEVSLKEKEILLREVHHRVKNNMQVISSILNLQSSYVSDEYTLNMLKESQNRIKTMAYIHESLYQNKSFTSVNFSDYVHTLVNNIVQSYSYSAEKIELDMDIRKMTLSLDVSIPAGLIINELITNAIKHAFPGTRKGRISFNLRCENNLVFLELKDNGVGFADGVDFENSHSLGLQLVNTLAEQIEGKIKFKSELNIGTEIIVTFKM